MVFYIKRKTTSEVSNQWVSRCTEWNFLLSFSDSDYKANVKPERLNII